MRWRVRGHDSSAALYEARRLTGPRLSTGRSRIIPRSGPCITVRCGHVPLLNDKPICPYIAPHAGQCPFPGAKARRADACGRCDRLAQYPTRAGYARVPK